MHRSLIFLALLGAGIGARAPIPHAADSPERHDLARTLPAETAAALGAGAAIAAGVWLEGSAPSPRGVPRRSAHARIGPEDAPAASIDSAVFLARATDSSEYLSTHALARAGRLAAHTTAPPPFRFV